MTSSAIWIGRDGQTFGPYAEHVVRDWLASGQVLPTTLAWRAGLADWQPLSAFLAIPEGYVPMPTSAGPPDSARVPVYETMEPPGFHPRPGVCPSYDLRMSLPRPPKAHWIELLVLSIVTCGLFAYVWFFVQARWVKKIDPKSPATLMLIAAVILTCVSPFTNGATGDHHFAGAQVFSAVLSSLAIIAAYFSMRRSVLVEAARLGLPMEIGGFTLFFFPALYLQGQLWWLARWRETGETTPAPPRDIFWLLLAPVGVLIAVCIAMASKHH